MNDAFVPVNVRQGHPHERGLINFLISLFRASALLLVLEFLLDGQVERHRRRVFEEFRRAEEMVGEYDEMVWSLRKTELLSAMGLILAPFVYEDETGILFLVRWLIFRVDWEKRLAYGGVGTTSQGRNGEIFPRRRLPMQIVGESTGIMGNENGIAGLYSLLEWEFVELVNGTWMVNGGDFEKAFKLFRVAFVCKVSTMYSYV
jgi:hypothetical protein